MNTLFEKNGGKYEMQGDYKLPCVALPQDTTEHIGVWGERHRRFLKMQHRVRYYNLLTSCKLLCIYDSPLPICAIILFRSDRVSFAFSRLIYL